MSILEWKQVTLPAQYPSLLVLASTPMVSIYVVSLELTPPAAPGKGHCPSLVN